MHIGKTTLINLFIFYLVIHCWNLPAQSSRSFNIQFSVPGIDNLIQGRLYLSHFDFVEGIQYLDISWLNGDVCFQNHTYKDLSLRYDIYQDILIFYPKTETRLLYPIELNREFVARFTIENRRFTNLKFSNYKDSGLKDGYYEIVLEGNFSLLIKRKLEINTLDSYSRFVSRDIRYLIFQGVAYRVRSKKALIKILGKASRKEVNNFLKTNQIYLSQSDDEDWRKIVAFLNARINPDHHE